MTHLHPLLICAPAVLALLVRRSRRGESIAAELARIIRDVLTLRMVLHDSEPRERHRLITAHSNWRTGARAGNNGTIASQPVSRNTGGEPDNGLGPDVSQ
ncbi:hypothetical protein [Streptomyces sp. NBC_00078]|uniref:hypothetical protein n=1 Tax=unclassified Streptomyces TaxID=2593676 RepID=UPI00224FA24E|nr:hypothetical protein [Streptomyces sp. NBC_00078]MCX5425890.1 hypothetical protein [Streptomyces sp. NBC_00078]